MDDTRKHTTITGLVIDSYKLHESNFDAVAGEVLVQYQFRDIFSISLDCILLLLILSDFEQVTMSGRRLHEDYDFANLSTQIHQWNRRPNNFYNSHFNN